ncbi:MAG TPA: sigma-54-dependent Fis family transcriptional regulator [Gammaproteobacteria bacterium]|nr:sigma-54-dependent Fis family transcriptional regulator [Gammaproteobacteria bacterium]
METSAKGKILIVDDDIASCRTLQFHLQSLAYHTEIAHCISDGLQISKTFSPDLIICDIRMPGRSGLEGLPAFKALNPRVHVIMITAFHDMATTIQAMQNGAEDYIHKPIDIDELDDCIERVFSRVGKDIIDTNIGNRHNQSPYAMIGRSRSMKEIFKTIGLVASSAVTVLITGESGTGKELVARAIHQSSHVADGPFVAINCAALVETLMESDMFGHEKGAFTGAVSRQPGKFSLAENGTIFLDELGELSLTTQAKLLRVLQEKEFTPLGAKQSQRTNARIIAATNADLAQKVKEGSFREDLYYRLKVVTISLPPLRERKEDIFDLVQVLLHRINKQIHRNVTNVAEDVVRCFQNYDWPGNVRELENVLAKAVALCSRDTITLNLVGDVCGIENQKAETTAAHEDLTQLSLEEIEKRHVIRVLEATQWHRGKTCDILKISRPKLRRMMSNYHLVAPDGLHFDDSMD